MTLTHHRQHEGWMREALRLADDAASAGEVPVGAVVVRGDAVIGAGANRTVRDQDASAHAEMLA
ncbi:MAG TPA: deaminase, partial [Gemmatimonadaceae bacterium]|nr:deaminase [Gemmatimonadaceae bacterium]